MCHNSQNPWNWVGDDEQEQSFSVIDSVQLFENGNCNVIMVHVDHNAAYYITIV